MGTDPHCAHRRLRNVDWDDLLPRLLLAAERFHQRHLQPYADAPEPRDLAHAAIMDVLNGNRRLPEDVKLFVTLHEIVRSKVSNFVAKKMRRGTVALDEKLLAITADAATDGKQHASYEHFKDAVRGYVRDDPFLERMIEYLFEDPLLKPADLAAMMGVDVHEVYNAYKRLRRRVALLRRSKK